MVEIWHSTVSKRNAVLAGLVLAGLYYIGSKHKPNTPVTPPPPMPKPSTTQGKFTVDVLMKASGTEKFGISMGAMGGESGLKDKAVQVAQDIIPKLNNGAKFTIVSKAYPKSFKDVDGGYRLVVSYIIEKPIKVTPAMTEHITSVLKSDSQFGDRIGKVVVT